MLKFRLLIASAVLLLMALFVPALPFSVPTYNYVFMLDITKSMNVTDYVEQQGGRVSRIEWAKWNMLQVAKSLPCGSRIGLGIFTERVPALLYSPIEVCDNYPVLQASIEKLDWRMAWVADSNIGQALYNTLALMQKPMLSQSRLVFFTDGHESPPINPRYAPDYEDLFEQQPLPTSIGIIVGVGEKGLSQIPKFDEEGNQIGFYQAEDVPHSSSFGLPEDPSKIEGYIPRNGPWGTKKMVGTEHLSSVREVYLQKLAEQSYMHYHHLQTVEDLAETLQQAEYADKQTIATDFNHWFGGLSLLCLLLSFVAKPASVNRKISQ